MIGCQVSESISDSTMGCSMTGMKKPYTTCSCFPGCLRALLMITQHGSTALHQCVHLDMQCTPLQHYTTQCISKCNAHHYSNTAQCISKSNAQHYSTTAQTYSATSIKTGHTASSASAQSAVVNPWDNPVHSCRYDTAYNFGHTIHV